MMMMHVKISTAPGHGLTGFTYEKRHECMMGTMSKEDFGSVPLHCDLGFMNDYQSLCM